MAKSKAKTAAHKRKIPRAARVVAQVKEPFSLLGALTEEGFSNAITFLTMAGALAGEAKKNLRLAALRPQLKELVSSLGFAFREDVEQLEARLEELEHRLAEKELALLRGDDE
jgi:hypothetical protein